VRAVTALSELRPLLQLPLLPLAADALSLAPDLSVTVDGSIGVVTEGATAPALTLRLLCLAARCCCCCTLLAVAQRTALLLLMLLTVVYCV
jgi:hypothetical protein